MKLSAAATAAWDESFLARLPDRASRALLDTSIEIEAEAGQIVHRERLSAPPMLLLVTSGLARVFVSSAHGREVTVRYARHGDVSGLASAIGGGARHGVQAVSRCDLVIVQAEMLRYLARTDGEVAWIICNVLKDIVFEITDHLSSSVFRSVNERVAAALTDLARKEDDCWVVDANQQQIADAVGSVREVVARSLRQLRAAGLIDRENDRILLKDMASLRRLAAYGAFTDPEGERRSHAHG